MKTALIGLGMVGSAYADALHRLAPGVVLGGVYARHEDSRAAFLDKYADKLPVGCRSYGSVDEIAADDSLDFVILTTPPNARREIVKTLAAQGKPILMEKPVERTLAAATELCEICEAANVPLGIVLQHRVRPSAVKVADLIASGGLGELAAVEVNVPWWRPQGYYDDPGRGTYARDGGGVLISQAIHTLDLLLSLTGPVQDVTALVATTALHRMEAEDFVSAGLRFDCGAVGTVLATTAAFPGRAEAIDLHFTRASVRLESNTLGVHWHDGRDEAFGASAATGAGADPMAFSSDWHMAIIADFADAVATGRPPRVPGRAALPVHALIEAIELSGQEGRRVPLPQPHHGT